jgi:hypothetical protein
MKPRKEPSKSETIRDICQALLDDKRARAKQIVRSVYPFNPTLPDKRRNDPASMMKVFLRDGFIDRYSGGMLVFPGVLRLLSHYMPDEFPFHPNWKMTDTHIAYWELIPTVDHIIPISRGGPDRESNLVTTSMVRNAAKTNWTLEELGWSLHPPGDIRKWDGLIKQFIALVEQDAALLGQRPIKKWYDLAVKSL